MQKKGQFITRLGALLLVLLLLPVFALTAIAAETEQEPVCYEHGDVNGDGKVDSRDAIYTLYHSIGSADYEVSQDCDFNGDGSVDSQDAIYVLYSTFSIFAEDYPLQGTIHEYYDPEWTWNEDGTVTAVFQCGCGKTHTLTTENGVKVDREVKTEATCVNTGVVEYVVTVTFAGETYTTTKTFTTPAAGHKLEGTLSCAEGISCANCDYALPALGHAWVRDAENCVAATCESQQAVEAYKCAACGETESVTLAVVVKHAFAAAEEVNVPEVGACAYQKVFACSDCGETLTGEVYYKHTYTAALTLEATCQTVGVKTFTCDSCGDSYTEEVPVNDTHTWVEGETVDGITTYTCACGASKTSVVVDGYNATVDTSALAGSELQLADVTVVMDEATLGGLGESVEMEIGTVAATELPVDEAAMAQIGENTVYDFNMASDGENVSDFAGAVTITLPYELQEGDDVDCIDVWFIHDDGTVECVMGTYSNGYVTFTTTHFSYYTVTRLTPAQRCAHYGHAMGYLKKEATCTQDGYDVAFCQRCGYEEKNEVLPMVEHTYEDLSVKPTCTEAGKIDKTCSVCRQKITGVEPALGHNWVLDEANSVAASCQSAGKKVYVCANGCGETYTEESAQMDHDDEMIEETRPDCNHKGHRKHRCKHCGRERTEDNLPPLGHSFKAEDVIWGWEEDGSSFAVTGTLKCGHDEAHTKKIKAVVTKTVGTNEQCKGVVTYDAVISFNGTEYTATKTVELDAYVHTTGDWETNANQHYHTCSVCGKKVDATAHNWGEQKVIKAATCGKEGKAETSCTVCAYKKTVTLPATGQHNFVNGVCSVCGYQENACTHNPYNSTEVDLSAANICAGSEIWINSCDCGKTKYLEYYLGCELIEEATREETLADGTVQSVTTMSCTRCGLVVEHGNSSKLVNAASCETDATEWSRISKDGTVIAESGNQYTTNHYATVVQTVNMADYGMCGGELVLTSCHCGKRTDWYTRNSECSWKHVSSDENHYIAKCSKCGAEQIREYSSAAGEETCEIQDTTVATWKVNGEAVLTTTARYYYYQHDWTLVSYEMTGESCEEGLSVHQKCSKCGQENRYKVKYHATVIEETIAFSGDYCIDGVVVRKCPCGAQADWSIYGEGYCSWEHYSHESVENGDKNVSRCTVCGLEETRIETTSAKDEDCGVQRTIDVTYTEPDGTVLASAQSSYESTDHDMLTTAELLEGSVTCEDGAFITNVCKDCGKTNSHTTYYHEVGTKARYDLTQYGLCGGVLRVYGCACGQEGGGNVTDDLCSWEWVKGETVEQRCVACGVTRIRKEWAEKVDTCKIKNCFVWTYVKDGETLLEAAWDYLSDDHRSVYQLTLLGETCEDGYTVARSCLDCEYTNDWSVYDDDHGTWAVDRKILNQEGQLCGDLELITYSCACGKEYSTEAEWRNGSCNFESSYYDNDLETWVYTCTTCGVNRWYTEEYVYGDDPCHYTRTRNDTYSKDGTVLFTYDDIDLGTSHDWLYTYQLQGDHCSDGYTYSRVCADCGATTSKDGVEYYCGTRMIARETLLENDGLCGAVYKKTVSCACGENYDVNIEDSCKWNINWYEDGYDYYCCEDCGAIKKVDMTWTDTEDPCIKTHWQQYIYTLDGENLLTYEDEHTYQEHRGVASFELLGDRCEDGYYRINTCVDCGRSYKEHNKQTYQGTWMTAYYRLSDYGMCGGEIYRYSCACGEHYSSWNYSYGCSFQTVAGEAEDGLDEVCPYCGTYRAYESTGKVNRDTCHYEGTFKVRLVRDGEELLSVDGKQYWEDHSMIVDYFEMHGETCDQGYYVHMKCQVCGDTETYSTYGHSTHAMENIDLAQYGLCGGEIRRTSCPCGERTGVEVYYDCSPVSWDSWSEQGEDGLTHYFQERSCPVCGFRYLQDGWSVVDKENCKQYNYYHYTFWAGETVIAEFDTANSYSSHTYGEPTCTLMAHSQDCEDGVYVTRTCKICGYVSQSQYHSHQYGVVNTVDLQPYGAVCETSLTEYACACGEYRKYDLTGDTKCDMDQVSIARWDDKMIYDSQYTTEGYVYTRSYAYMLTCAVTDPEACAFKIRMAEYWVLEDDCMAVEYQTWQLGYDPETDTWLEEYTVPTGERHAYHTYETENVTATNDDGSWTQGTESICTSCGSSYIVRYYYDANGNNIAYEDLRQNTLDNGEMQKYRRFHEYGVQHAGYSYITLDLCEYTYADGSEYWEKYIYTYDFAAGCIRTVVYSDSDGGSSTYKDTAHYTSWSRETTKKSTCSQLGTYVDRYTCTVCGEVTSEYTGTLYPSHSWLYNSSLGCYVCSVCGLENANGASGAIIMEDLTETYGEDTNYVVGYYNRDNLEVLKYISVILDEVGEDQDNEIVLSGITINELTADKDGITAISFSQSEAQAAAKAAVEEAGYAGSYAIRFTFVPKSGDDTLDYAITFDSMEA